MPLVLAAVIAGSIGSGPGAVGAMTLAMRFAARPDQAGTDMTVVSRAQRQAHITATRAGRPTASR